MGPKNLAGAYLVSHLRARRSWVPIAAEWGPLRRGPTEAAERSRGRLSRSAAAALPLSSAAPPLKLSGVQCCHSLVLRNAIEP